MDGDSILWDLVEEHLDEAEFLLEQWLDATRSPRFTLTQLQKTVEPRLDAHLQGLGVGGAAVADRLLWPALARETAAPAPRVAAAALALLLDPGPAARDGLIARFSGSGGGTLLAGLRLTFTLCERADLDEPLRLALYATDAPAAQVGLLDVLAARRLDPGPIMGNLLRSADPAVLVAALNAAAASEPGQHQYLVEALLAAKVPAVREAALRTTLLWNLAAGWKACVAEARAGAPAAMLFTAQLGGPGELALLTSALQSPAQRPAALFALGFSGRAEAVAACLPFLDDPDPKIAKLAAEAVAAITDLPVEEKPFALSPPDDAGDEELPPLEEDLAVDLTPDPADALPLVDAARVRAWWADQKAAYKPGGRYLRGQPLTAATAQAAISDSPLRRFDPLVFEITIRTGNRPPVPALRLGFPKPKIAPNLSFARQPAWR